MSIKIVVKKNTYFDSVSLMSISTRANKIDGVEQAFVAMATGNEQRSPEESGTAGRRSWKQRKRRPWMIVINGGDGADNEQILSGIEALFGQKRKAASTKRAMPPSPALKHLPDSNMAVISSQRTVRRPRSTTGVTKRSQRVMLFSDNVSRGRTRAGETTGP